MVEDIKRHMRRFENLIGVKGEVDVSSKDFINELIRALTTRYKANVYRRIRLHQLEFFYDLIERSRRKKQKAVVEEEDEFQPAKRKGAAEFDEEEKPTPKKAEKKIPDDIPTVEAKDIDDWKDFMTLSKVYYVLEHPRSELIRWKRRITKKKTITKFGDRDLIEWRVAQYFRLRGLEEWAQSRRDARKLADESPYDFDGIDEESETKEIEDMFHIFDTSKKSKPKNTKDLPKIQKNIIKTTRPFKLTDECVEDWTESYSDDSDESDTLEDADEIHECSDEDETEELKKKESTLNEEECIRELFLKYRKLEKYRNPIFEKMDEAESLQIWYNLYYEATGKISKIVEETLKKEDSVPIKEEITEDAAEETKSEITEPSTVPEDDQATVEEDANEISKESPIREKIEENSKEKPEDEKETEVLKEMAEKSEDVEKSNMETSPTSEGKDLAEPTEVNDDGTIKAAASAKEKAQNEATPKVKQDESENEGANED